MKYTFAKQTYLCGKSRRKLTELILSISTIDQIDEQTWGCKVKLSGYLDDEYEARESSSYNSLTIGIAYLRQSLRRVQEENNKLKFYEDIGDEIIERTVEEIFWTHDCITDEMEDMIDWARSNGYKPE